jgi:hypothetical protein
VCLPDASSQETTITSIDLIVKNGILSVRLHLRNLLDENFKDAIASGMSRSLNVQFELLEKDQNPLYNRFVNVGLKYDVWESTYLLNISGDERQFETFEYYQAFLSDSMQFDVGTINTIDPDKSLQLGIVVSKQALSELQKKKLNYWLSSEAETSESQPGLEPDQGFSINLSKMLTLFFKRERSSETYMFKSPIFTIKSLRHDENLTK